MIVVCEALTKRTYVQSYIPSQRFVIGGTRLCTYRIMQLIAQYCNVALALSELENQGDQLWVSTYKPGCVLHRALITQPIVRKPIFVESRTVEATRPARSRPWQQPYISFSHLLCPWSF